MPGWVLSESFGEKIGRIYPGKVPWSIHPEIVGAALQLGMELPETCDEVMAADIRAVAAGFRGFRDKRF